MPAKHRIRAREVARDIRAGATDSDLMAKYDLSDEDLQVLFNKLVEGGTVQRHEILDRASKSERRTMSREYLTFGLQIQDVRNPSVKAVVRNLSDTGFRAAVHDALNGDFIGNGPRVELPMKKGDTRILRCRRN